MQTGSIGKQDQWTRFLQVSNEARVRNQGLAGASARKRQVTAPSRSMSRTAMPAAVPSYRTTSLYATSRPVVSGRILGGTFDAYA